MSRTHLGIRAASPATRARKQLLRRECRVGDAVAKHSPVDADPRHPLVAGAIVSLSDAGTSKDGMSSSGVAAGAGGRPVASNDIR